MNKTKLKTPLLLLAGVLIGALLSYGFMWYQVYGKFNTVWTCQVFTGALTIDEAKHCEQYKASKDSGALIYYR